MEKYISVHFLIVLCLSCIQSLGPQSSLLSSEDFFSLALILVSSEDFLWQSTAVYITTPEVTGFQRIAFVELF